MKFDKQIGKDANKDGFLCEGNCFHYGECVFDTKEDFEKYGCPATYPWENPSHEKLMRKLKKR